MTGWADRHPVLLLAAFSALYALSVAGHSRARPIWHDEVVTIVVAGQPTIADVRQALTQGADLQPPLNTLLTRASIALGGPGAMQARLPAMIGVWAGCVALFVMVRRRSHTVLGLAAALVACQSAVFRFAYESRGYGLLFGLTAIAAFAWSEAAGPRRRPRHLVLLALSIGGAIWAHYYAVLIVAPIVAAEVWRAVGRRRIDWSMIAAVGAGFAAALPLVPIAGAAVGQAGTFWARGEHQSLAAIYGFVLGPLVDPIALAGAGVAVVMGVIGAIAGWPRTASAPLPRHEVVFGLAALAMPVAGVAIGAFTTGFTPRYGLAAIAGVALVITLAAWQSSRRRARVDLVVAATLVLAFAGSVRFALAGIRSPQPDPYVSRALLQRELAGGGPVVVTGGLTFAQLWHYAPADARPRLVFLADPEAARRATGADTIDAGLLALSRWAPMNVQRYDDFLARHQTFTVYAFGSGWLLDRLDADGIGTTEAGRELGARILRAAR